MQKAVYPEKTCREPVGGEHQVYYCELPLTHPGPCASFSVRMSEEIRDRYEAENPEWRTKLGSIDIVVDSKGVVEKS